MKKRILNFSLFESAMENPTSREIIFDWLEYDSKVGDPIQSSIPKTLTLEEIINFSAENESRIKEIEKSGIYVSHTKSPIGFDRIIVSSYSPLLIDVAQFNKKFEKTNEIKKVKASSNLEMILKGSGLIRSRFS